jgi:modification methylase
MEGSIHQVGAAAQNTAACNGWVYWYYEDKKRGLVSIDELRKAVRAELYPDLA